MTPNDGKKSECSKKKKSNDKHRSTSYEYKEVIEVDYIDELVMDDNNTTTTTLSQPVYLTENVIITDERCVEVATESISTSADQYIEPNMAIIFDEYNGPTTPLLDDPNDGEEYIPDIDAEEEDMETAYLDETLLQATGEVLNNIEGAVAECADDYQQPMENNVKALQPENIRTSTTMASGKSHKNKKSQKLTVVKMKSPAAYVCMTCKHKYNSFEELKDHMENNKQCKEMHMTCETCGKVCENKKSLYQHQLTHKEKNTFVCDECGKIYTNRFNLENHKSSVHGDRVEECGSIYKCKVCDDQFTNRADLYAHIKFHTKLVSLYLGHFKDNN